MNHFIKTLRETREAKPQTLVQYIQQNRVHSSFPSPFLTSPFLPDQCSYKVIGWGRAR